MKNFQVAFCFGDLKQIKQSALFCDWVAPFPMEAFESGGCVTSSEVAHRISEYIPLNVFDYLLGPISAIALNPDDYGSAGHEFRCQFLVNLLTLPDISYYIANNIDISEKKEGRELGWMRAYGIDPIMVLPLKSTKNIHAEDEDISITMSGLDLIDTSNISWEQIVEFRQDEIARKKLRNLRLFFNTNYKGKNVSFIEDDLGKRIDDYKNLVKDHGFETVTSNLTMVSNSKNIITFGTAGLASILLGEPILGSAALAAGVSLDLANIAINIAQKKHSFNKLRRDLEISYLLDLHEISKN